MGDPISMAAAGASMASTGLSAFGSIASGNTAAQNAQANGQSQLFSSFYSAQQAQLAAQVGELRATQTDTYMRENTNNALANIDAVQALGGEADNSPSDWAVRNRYGFEADRARTQATDNLRLQSQAQRNAAQLYMLSGMNAMNAANSNASALRFNGLLGGAGALLHGISGMNWNTGGGGGDPTMSGGN